MMEQGMKRKAIAKKLGVSVWVIAKDLEWVRGHPGSEGALREDGLLRATG